MIQYVLQVYTCARILAKGLSFFSVNFKMSTRPSLPLKRGSRPRAVLSVLFATVFENRQLAAASIMRFSRPARAPAHTLIYKTDNGNVVVRARCESRGIVTMFFTPGVILAPHAHRSVSIATVRRGFRKRNRFHPAK